MTRVLFVCPNLNVGGAERHWATLLPDLQQYDLTPSVLTLDGTGHFYSELRSAGIAVHCASLRRSYDVPRLASAIGTARSLRPAVVVSRATSALIVGQLIARISGARHLYNEHRQIDRPHDPRREQLIRALAPRATGAIAISTLQRPDLARLGFRQDRVWVVPNGVPAINVEESTVRQLRAQLGVSDHFCAILVAALRPEKNVDMFVKALGRMASDSIVGLVVGDGPERSRLEHVAATEHAPVRFLGSRPDAVALMAAADVVCLTSRFEGVPMALLEAMSVGTPTIATNVGGVREIVCHQETGLIVDQDDTHGLANAMRTLLHERDARDAYGVEALRRHRGQFTTAHMASGYARVLRWVAETPLAVLASPLGAEQKQP